MALSQVRTVSSACSTRSAQKAFCPAFKTVAPQRISSSLQARKERLVRVQATSTYKLQELEKQGLVVDEELLKLPHGYHWYETMMVLRPTLSEEERDKELAKFEAFLNKEECMNISALVRGRSRMAYPIKGNWEGIYVLYTYAAKRQTARTVQLLLSNPEAGSEDNVLRHITMCKY